MDPRRLLPVLTTVAAVAVAVTLVVLGWRAWSPGQQVTSSVGHERSLAARAATGATPGARTSPAAVLAAWDAERSAAWARGDASALRDLYVAGSRAGSADVKLLRRYAQRGLRVTGLQTQVLDLEVVAARSGRLHLVVVDRVVGGVAVGGDRRVTLPRDRPSRRHVLLVRTAERWLVDRVWAGSAEGG